VRRLIAPILSSVLMLSCSNAVTIHYKPLQNAHEITGVKGGAVGGSFLADDQTMTIYRIVSITNEGSAAFTFDTDRTFACSQFADGLVDDTQSGQDYGRPHFARSNGKSYAPKTTLSVPHTPTGSSGTPTDIHIVITHKKECFSAISGSKGTYPLLSYASTAEDKKNFDVVIVPDSDLLLPDATSTSISKLDAVDK